MQVVHVHRVLDGPAHMIKVRPQSIPIKQLLPMVIKLGHGMQIRSQRQGQLSNLYLVFLGDMQPTLIFNVGHILHKLQDVLPVDQWCFWNLV